MQSAILLTILSHLKKLILYIRVELCWLVNKRMDYKTCIFDGDRRGGSRTESRLGNRKYLLPMAILRGQLFRMRSSQRPRSSAVDGASAFRLSSSFYALFCSCLSNMERVFGRKRAKQCLAWRLCGESEGGPWPAFGTVAILLAVREHNLRGEGKNN